jgi:hypothetical protein
VHDPSAELLLVDLTPDYREGEQSAIGGSDGRACSPDADACVWSTAAVPLSSVSRVFPPVTGVVASRSALCAGGAESVRASSAAARAPARAIQASKLPHAWCGLDAHILFVFMVMFASSDLV